jgi:CubicO group peptidase (beta-lactamase class C family)
MTPSSTDTWQHLADYVAEMMERHKVPGVALGVFCDGETQAGGLGVTHVDHPLPVTADTLFQIGSITKTFVGTAALRLVEQGALDLRAPVRTYLPDFRVADEEASAGATLWHLLTHTGGWAGDFFHDTGAGEDALARYVADMADLPQEAPLGTQWSYNNAGFSVLGRVLEVVTGQGFAAALRELVLQPLGLACTFLDPDEVMTRRFVAGHAVERGVPRVARPWGMPAADYPMGGLVSTVVDLLRYARFHLGDGCTEEGARLLAPATLAAMQAPEVPIWKGEAWGLSWAVDEVGGGDEAAPAAVRLVRHGGGTKGQVSHLLLVPSRGFALAVGTNSETGGAITEGVRRWALREYLGLDWPKPQPQEVEPQALAEFAGYYQGYFEDLELAMLAGRLVGQAVYKRGFPSEAVPPPPAPPPVSLGLCEADRLLVLDGPEEGEQAEVVRRADGSIGWLRFGGRLHTRRA